MNVFASRLQQRDSGLLFEFAGQWLAVPQDGRVSHNTLVPYVGQTIFIGGLIRERDETVRRGIPLLMRLPLLGSLFGRTVHSQERSELITLIRPRIVDLGQDVPYQGLTTATPAEVSP